MNLNVFVCICLLFFEAFFCIIPLPCKNLGHFANANCKPLLATILNGVDRNIDPCDAQWPSVALTLDLENLLKGEGCYKIAVLIKVFRYIFSQVEFLSVFFYSDNHDCEQATVFFSFCLCVCICVRESLCVPVFLFSLNTRPPSGGAPTLGYRPDRPIPPPCGLLDASFAPPIFLWLSSR